MLKPLFNFLRTLFNPKPQAPKTLIEALQCGFVELMHETKQGDYTHHVATLNMKLIPCKHHPKGTGRRNTHATAYFSISSQGWRSCLNELLEGAKWTYLGGKLPC
jgi:hypothetical protein